MSCSSLNLVKKGQVMVVNSLKALGDLQVLSDEGPETVPEEEKENGKEKSWLVPSRWCGSLVREQA